MTTFRNDSVDTVRLLQRQYLAVESTMYPSPLNEPLRLLPLPEDYSPGAKQCGLDAVRFSKEEKRMFPIYFKELSDDYLRIRNCISTEWLSKCKEFLSLEAASALFQENQVDIAKDAWQFLNRFGHINFGFLFKRDYEISAEQPKTVVIVGGGISGLNCARHVKQLFHAAGKSVNVFVLEASERIGGRVTFPLQGVDVGLDEFDGTSRLSIVLKKQLEMETYGIVAEPANIIPVFDIDGNRIATNLKNEMDQLFNQMVLEAAEESNATMSLGDQMARMMDEHDLEQVDARLLHWRIAALEMKYACSAERLSLDLLKDRKKRERLGVKGGFGQFVKGIMSGPSCLSHLNNEFLKENSDGGVQVFVKKQVQEIHYNPKKQKLSIFCTDDTGYFADAVVLSVPLGVLKSEAIKFEPQLPDQKLRCISRMGFGLLNRIILIFPVRFWDSLKSFGCLNAGDSGSYHDHAKIRGDHFLFKDLSSSIDKPTLACYVSGRAAYEMERKSISAVVDQILLNLSRIFVAKLPIPTPVEVHISNWATNPFSLGTHSYLPPTSSSLDYEILGESCHEGRLIFSGEATCVTHPASIDGSFISGLNAARHVADLFLDPIGNPEVVVPDVCVNPIIVDLISSDDEVIPESSLTKDSDDHEEVDELASDMTETQLYQEWISNENVDRFKARKVMPNRGRGRPRK